MPSNDELIHDSAVIEAEQSANSKIVKKTLPDYFALAISTCGVGYLPLAPGTFGSLVGVLIYLFFGWLELKISNSFALAGASELQATAWIHAGNLILFLLFCLLGIWASNRATILFQTKDPQKVVVDEVIGQLITFLFVPFVASWQLVLAGFLLFRLFDIWKPYPIDSLENLPAGIGVCADDILAGIYAGISLTILYAVTLSI